MSTFTTYDGCHESTVRVAAGMRVSVFVGAHGGHEETQVHAADYATDGPGGVAIINGGGL